MNKVIDTYTPEGLQKLQDILQPGNKRVNQLLTAIKEEQAKTPGAPGFGNTFWGMTKSARADEINTGLKEFSKQVQAAGYDGVRFRDDSHPTIAVFDPGDSRNTELDKALSGEGKPPGGGEKPPEEPPGPPEPEKVAEARAAIRDQLSVKKESGDAPWYTAEGRSKIWDKIYTSLVDRLDPLNTAVKDATAGEGGPDLEASKNPYVLARNFPGWKGKMMSFLGGGKETGPFSKFRGESTDGTIDFKTGKVNGEGLGKILGDIKPEEQQAFTDYAMAKRSLERTDNKFETGIKPEDAKTLIAADGSKFEEHFQRLVSYSDRVMTYAKDAGLISEESFNKIKKGSKDYIPFLREQDFDEFTGKTKGQDGGLYEEFEGSKRKILNPIEQIMRNTARVVKAADLNQVKMTFGVLSWLNRL